MWLSWEWKVSDIITEKWLGKKHGDNPHWPPTTGFLKGEPCKQHFKLSFISRFPVMSALVVPQIFSTCLLEYQHCSVNNYLIVRSSVILMWKRLQSTFKGRLLPWSQAVQRACRSTTTSRCTKTTAKSQDLKCTFSRLHNAFIWGYRTAFLSRTPQPWITHQRPHTALQWINPISYSPVKGSPCRNMTHSPLQVT